MDEITARRTLTGKFRLTGKVADFLLATARQTGNGPHLKCEVYWTAADGYMITDSRRQ